MTPAEQKRAEELAREWLRTYKSAVPRYDEDRILVARVFLALLERMEPVEIKLGVNNPKWGDCPCGGVAHVPDKFCPNCGRPIRWKE